MNGSQSRFEWTSQRAYLGKARRAPHLLTSRTLQTWHSLHLTALPSLCEQAHAGGRHWQPCLRGGETEAQTCPWTQCWSQRKLQAHSQTNAFYCNDILTLQVPAHQGVASWSPTVVSTLFLEAAVPPLHKHTVTGTRT